MPDIFAPGVTPEQMQAFIAGLGVGDIGTYTLATLPDPAGSSRRTIWVTDLWSGLPAANQGGRMVSEGGVWKPIRPLVVSAMAVAADFTLQPFVQGTTLLITGALAATRNVTLGGGSGFAVAYPGYRQRVTRKATGLLGLVVNGVGLSLNGWADFEYDGAAWQQTASGGLL